MSVHNGCPCDIDGVYPYESESWGSCEYWCGSEEPQDEPYVWDECPEAEDNFLDSLLRRNRACARR